MGIKGDVRSMPLANVLQDLAMNEQTGTLLIRQKDRQIDLWFERGALRLVGLGPGEGPSLVNGLLATGKIKPEEIPPLTGRRTTEGSFTRGLVKKGRVTKEDLRSALEQQMAEHLCDALLWSEALFEFDEGDPDDRSFDADQLDLEPKLSIDVVVMEAARRHDEWNEVRKAVLSAEEILVPEPSRLPPDADGTTKRVFGLLDGERTLHEVQGLTRLGAFNVHRAAALLLRAGALRPLNAASALERARARAGKREWDASLRMARYGLDHERNNADLLDAAIAAAEGLDDHEVAASFARQLAAARAEAGNLEAAIGAYRKVLAHAPRDLTAHERLFATLLEMDLKLDAMAAGEALAAAYKKLGLTDKALEVYQKLVEEVGDQTDLLESLAEMERHLGDRREAAGIYRKLLVRALEAHDDGSALDYCRTILRLDPKNDEALRIRLELESGQMEQSRKRKRRFRGYVALAVLLALAGLVTAYEWNARTAHSEVRKALREAERAGRHREALDLYDRVLEPYPWSFTARGLRPDRELVEESYVADEIRRAGGRVDRGQIVEAQKALEAALPSVRREELRSRLSREIDSVRARVQAEQARWEREVASRGTAEIAELREPGAVAALAKLAAETRAEIGRRKAAITALGAIEGKEAEAALQSLLADASIKLEAGAELARRGKPPLQAEMVAAKAAFPGGEAVAVAWRLTNVSRGEVEFSLDEAPARRLQVTLASQPAATGPGPASHRHVRLGPGEFLGGTFDITGSLPAPGKYHVHWAAAITWGGQSAVLEAPTLVVERTK